MSDVRVTFFGDSIVAGVGDPQGAGWVGRVVAGAFSAGVPLTAYNLGVRRETSADVLARWEAEIAPRLIDAADCRLVFCFGANDATWENGGPRVEPAQSLENLARVLATARQRALPVLVVGPPPVGDPAQRDRIGTLSAGFREIAARHGAPYVELAGPLRRSPVWKRELEAGDGAHPGGDGYALVADLVMEAWLTWLSASVAAAASESTGRPGAPTSG